MRIAHISDLHIRNFKYKNEYYAAFDDLYSKLKDLSPDIVINTGDTVHSKLTVSPELFDTVAEHIREVTNIAPYWMILGNHDLNLKNPDRTDAISPIVRAISTSTNKEISLLQHGRYCFDDKFCFWHWDIRGGEDFTNHINDDYVNIGLFHGSIKGCLSDMGRPLDGEEISKFSKMDFVLMGDIHKRQSFADGRIAYPGSLIQQNYGEDATKGFLLWDITDKNKFSVDFHAITAPSRFMTIAVTQNLDLSDIDIPNSSRIRVVFDGELSPSKRAELENKITQKFSPLEIITVAQSESNTRDEPIDVDQLMGSRDSLMRDHLLDAGVSEDAHDFVIELFKSYEKDVSGEDAQSRGTIWSLKRVAWDNMMNYGNGNFVNVSKLSGLIGIFGPNTSGKSSIFDIFLESLFDKVPKDVPRNIDLVNDNKDSGTMNVEFESGGSTYTIERKIERINYGQKKSAEIKQWGKTSLDFSKQNVSLNGDGRTETEREIRKIIGSFEDFTLTSMLTQNPIFGLPGGGDIVNCKETDRRKILFKFLDLDLYERINSLAKDGLKELVGKLKGLDCASLEMQSKLLIAEMEESSSKILFLRQEISILETELIDVRKCLETADIKNVVSLVRSCNETKREVISYETAVNNTSSEISACETLVLSRKNNLAMLLLKKPVLPAMPLDVLIERAANISLRKQSLAVTLSSTEIELARGIKSLKTLDGIPCEGKFPNCKFISEAVDFTVKRKEIENAIASFYSEIDVYNGELLEIGQYEVVHKDIAEWEKEKTKLELEISKYEVSLSSLNLEKDREDGMLRRLKDELSLIEENLRLASADEVRLLREKEKSLVMNIANKLSNADDLLKSVGAIESKIATIAENISSFEGIQEKTKACEFLVDMTGKGGLPYRILTMVLPAINLEISKILSGIVKFNVYFENDSDDQNISLYIRYGDYKSRPLGLGSGSEKFIASLAIRAALLTVSSLPKTDILIIDEGFGKLDPEHLESMQKMLEYLKGVFKAVFIVSHVDSMRDIVDYSIDISSHDGYAHVEAG